jgi:hypothetical protein
VVIERTFAEALRVRVGSQVTVADQPITGGWDRGHDHQAALAERL